MKKPRLPWTLRGSDFNRAGWHVEPTTGFQLMFEFLLVSPSYELARRERAGLLAEEERARLPEDFAQVLATFDLLGDVNFKLFRQWWLDRGLRVFGNPYSKPKLHEVAHLASGQETDLALLTSCVQERLVEQRQSEGLSPALIVSLPLSAKRADVMRMVRKLLDGYKESDGGNRAEPKIRLQGERFHPNAMLKGLRLLWFKAARPEWENWRLGAKTRLSDSYSGVLDPQAPRRASTSIEMDDRIILGKITHRALVRFELIAENAARGRFPCTDPVPMASFDYPQLAKRLRQNAQWNRKRKEDWIRRNGTEITAKAG